MIRWLTIFTLAVPLIAQQSSELQQALAERIDIGKKAVGIVAGTIGPQGEEVVAHGCASIVCEKPMAKDAVFEIGSITKVFTALLLADMAERGEVKLDDPVRKYLPESVTVPSRNERQITLIDLATHTSGLPRLPKNMDPAEITSPYARYDATRLYDFLSTYTLPRDPGEKHEYSNLGAALLGHALSLRAGTPYPELLRKRILDPLSMTSTTVGGSAELRRRQATGHGGDLKPVPNWDFDVFAPAGALRSTASDMLKFASAAIGATDTPLKAAFARLLSTRRPMGAPEMEQAMGWIVLKRFGSEVLLHDGGTAGFRSAIAVHPAARKAAIVLANTATDVTDIAMHAVNSKFPLIKVSPPKKEVSVADKMLDAYVGEYRLTPTFAIKVSRKGNRLVGQATNQPEFELFAESESKFFVKVVDAQITFLRDDAGGVTGLILHQMGREQKADRIR